MKFALDFGVLPAIAVEPLQPFGIIEPICAGGIFILMRLPRFRHLAHQPLASGIFAVSKFERVGCSTEARRQSERQGCGLCANSPFRRH